MSSPKSQTRVSAEKVKSLPVKGPRHAVSKNADASILQDIDAILSRIDVGIAKGRKAMDDLLERIRQPAA